MRIIASIIVLLFAVPLFGQPLTETTYEMNLETAEEQLALNDYYNARDYFIKAYEQQKSSELAHRIAELHYMLKDYRRAASWYKRIFRRDKEDRYLAARFDYANVLKMQGKYEEAYDEFNYYIERTADDVLKERAKNEITGMQLAGGMEEDVSISVTNTGRPINGKFLEASPSLDRDGTMYFSTIRSDDVIVLDGKREDVYSMIYSASAEDDKKSR